jgi:hypothetical protein
MCACSVDVNRGALSSVKAFVCLQTECEDLIVAFEEVADWKWRSVYIVIWCLQEN